MKTMKCDDLNHRGMAVLIAVVIVMLVAPVARAGSLLDEMRVPDTCGTTYASKLGVCVPFRCTKPSPMAMMFGFPSDDELKLMPPKQQQMRKSMAAG